MDTMPLLHPDKAFALLRGIEYRLEEEETDLSRANGRVLSRTVMNPVDSPPFDKAAMDGYALRSTDYRGEAGEEFRLLETVAAGDVPVRIPGPGECVRIMTGAPMPEGTDKVIRVEYTEAADTRITVHTPEPADNVIRRGENIRAGDELIRPGRLKPQDIGILASGGISRVTLRRQARMGIITTGSEIKEPGETLAGGKIYNSNGAQLAAQIEAAGALPINYGIVEDEPAALRRAVDRGLEETDILLLSGGVSMGDFDFVPGVLREAGVEVLFHRLAVKPGRPTLFGRRADTFVFGLPGNPVSTFIIFEMMVREFLGIINGIPCDGRSIRGRLGGTVKRKSASRVEYRPGKTRAGRIEPLPYYGSNHLNALAGADCIFRIDQGVTEIPEGTEIDARLI